MIYKEIPPGVHVNTTYSNILNQKEIENDLLKPIHLYAQRVSPKPEKIDNIYRQLLYSETLVLFEKNDNVSIICRCATIPYKKIMDNDKNAPEDCFKTLYAFYVPWFLDIDKNIVIKNSDVDNYAFYLPDEIKINFFNLYKLPRDRLNEVWIPFYIKKNSIYIKKDYGKLDKNIPIYDMIIE